MTRRLMNSLGRKEKELIFDCCLGLTGAEQVNRVRRLLAHSEQAAGLHARLLIALLPLGSLHCEPCPEELAERTVRLLCAMAQARKRQDAPIPLDSVS